MTEIKRKLSRLSASREALFTQEIRFSKTYARLSCNSQSAVSESEQKLCAAAKDFTMRKNALLHHLDHQIISKDEAEFELSRLESLFCEIRSYVAAIEWK